MAVFADESLDKEITFNAGSHREVVRMSYGDFQNLVRPVLMPLVMQRAKGHTV